MTDKTNVTPIRPQDAFPDTTAQVVTDAHNLGLTGRNEITDAERADVMSRRGFLMRSGAAAGAVLLGGAAGLNMLAGDYEPDSEVLDLLADTEGNIVQSGDYIFKAGVNVRLSPYEEKDSHNLFKKLEEPLTVRNPILIDRNPHDYLSVNHWAFIMDGQVVFVDTQVEKQDKVYQEDNFIASGGVVTAEGATASFDKDKMMLTSQTVDGEYVSVAYAVG